MQCEMQDGYESIHKSLIIAHLVRGNMRHVFLKTCGHITNIGFIYGGLFIFS